MRTFTVVIVNNKHVNIKASDRKQAMKIADTLYGSGNWKFLSDTIGKRKEK